MNKNNFNKMISQFSKVYEKILEPEVLSIYFNLFKEIPDNQVKHITNECLKKCNFFPRPADVFSFYDEYASEKREIITAGQEDMERSRQGIRKLREQFGTKKEPMGVGDIIKTMKPKVVSQNYPESEE
jgi:hypothetical protein